MQRVDFYILSPPLEKNFFLCRLIEKIYLGQQSIFVLTQDAEMSEQLDALLWSFRDDSFLPHEICERQDSVSPILLSHKRENWKAADVLINLAEGMPDCCKEFQRVIEIVGHTNENLENSRQKYRLYQKNQCELFSHKINERDHDGKNLPT